MALLLRSGSHDWDASNRLSQLVQCGSTGSAGTTLTASFSYDAFGRRIQSSITRANQSPSTVQYLYKGQQALGEIRDGKLGHRLLTRLSLDETKGQLQPLPAAKAVGSEFMRYRIRNGSVLRSGCPAPVSVGGPAAGSVHPKNRHISARCRCASAIPSAISSEV